MSDPDLDEAVKLALEGKLHQGLLLLKVRKGLSLQDARAKLAEAIDTQTQLAGTTSSSQEQALQEAFDAADTFDEITVDMLRYCKEVGLPIATQPELTASEIRTIASNIRQQYLFLIEHNVNPTRAMRAILTHDAHAVDDAAAHKLVNDLTSLL